MKKQEQLEAELNDFDAGVRRAALEALVGLVGAGDIELPEPKPIVNLHCHTFFSFNGYGYSPTYFAWKARCAGLMAAGVIDFDVLDAVDEFLAACALLGLRGCTGLETRVYVPAMSDLEINSPGEPGVAYHIGVGFVEQSRGDSALLGRLKDVARKRNLGVLGRINPHLEPAALDYEADVLRLTPSGNATERHLCMAYDEKARERFPDDGERAAFWAEKLGVSAADVGKMFAEPPVFQGLIRSKLMKAGGVGYVKPEGPDFPSLTEVSEFILSAGGIPVLGWLDGLSEAEQSLEALTDCMVDAGAAAVNIVPDRNWRVKDPELKKTKVAKLHEVIRLAQSRDMPIIVGTEMNAHGQRFIDDFDAPEMEPLVEPALEGAYILHAHTALESAHGLGYLSSWAKNHFTSAREKNVFYAKAGQLLDPQRPDLTGQLDAESSPDQLLARLTP